MAPAVGVAPTLTSAANQPHLRGAKRWPGPVRGDGQHQNGGSMEPRPSVDEYWMHIAHEVADRATCLRGKHGAVVVDRGGRIVSTGYNGAPQGHPHCTDVGCLIGSELGEMEEHCFRTVHADMNAVHTGLASGQSMRMLGSTMYVTGHPCLRCLPQILQSGIRRIVYELHGYKMPEGIDDYVLYLLGLFSATIEHTGGGPLDVEETRGRAGISHKPKPTKGKPPK